MIEEEKRKWEIDKIVFESNPIHWSNNKRKMYGMNTLRGSVNKNRILKFSTYRPSPKLFSFVEDTIEKLCHIRIENALLKNFVDVKDLKF